MRNDADRGSTVTIIIVNPDQMIRSKKQYHRYSGILLYSTTFYFTSIHTRRSLLLYKGHTRQSSASSPLAVVTASFVRHFFLRRLFFFFSSSLSLLFFSSLYTSSQLRLNSPFASLYLLYYLLYPPGPRTTPPSDLFHRRSPISVTNTFRRPSFCRFSSFYTTSGTEDGQQISSLHLLSLYSRPHSHYYLLL